MRISGLTVTVLLALPLVAVAQVSQETAPALVTLRGVLVDAASGAAVRRARVDISSGPTRIGAVMSDDEGRFALDVPADLEATLRITKAGYATVTRIASAADVRGAVPQLIAVDRGAAIVGRVVDAAGEPMPLGAVLVRRALERPGPTNLFVSVTPDESGEFRAGGLAPGRYIVDNIAGPETNGLRADAVEVLLEPGQETPVIVLFTPVVGGDTERPAGLQVNVSTGAGTTVTIAAPQIPAAGQAIRGVVTSAAGRTIRGATVAAIGSGGVRRGAITDAEGRFTIQGLLPGAYTVEARARGYVRGEHGQRGLDLPGTKVTVEAGADAENVDIALSSGGAVSGIVYDQFGEPLQEAAVNIVRVRRSASGLMPVRDPAPASVRTDDRGQFRAVSLLPGEYIVTASFSAHLVVAGVRAAYATTFWPAGADLAGAAPLEVRAAEEIGGLTLTLPLAAVTRVAGAVVTSTGAPAAGTVRLMLARSSEGSADLRTTTLGDKGQFSFDDVTAGEYVVYALAANGGNAAESGRRPLIVGSGSPDPILIRTSPGSTLSGRFVLEGARPGDLMWGYSATAVAEGVSWAPGTVSNLGGPIDDGAPFRLSSLTGPTRLRITSEDENWHLKSIVIDGFDAADGAFDFGFDGKQYSDVQVVFSRLGATLTGHATDERGRPVRDYAVYVFSTERDKWVPGSRWVRLARAAADGTFRIPSLPPGTYWTVAVDRIDAALGTPEASDAALLDTLAPYATSVPVAESETRELTLRVLAR